MKKKIIGLDSLRFVLALWVLLSHVGGPPIFNYLNLNNQVSKFLLGIYNNSFVGVAAVIAFFIISGLVIHYPYKDGEKINILEFYSKRYIRIGIPMIFISCLAYYLNSFETLPFWSLYAELIYYTIYPLILWLMNKISLTKIVIIAFITSYTLAIFMSYDFLFFINYNMNNQDHYNGNYWQFGNSLTWLLGLPCWLLGVLLADNIKDFSSIKISYKSLILSRILILVISIFCSIARFHFHLSYILSLNLFSIAAYLWIYKEVIYYSNNKSFNILEWGGKWSYSLYICHSLIPVFFAMLNLHMNNTFLMWFLEVLGALIFSYLFFLMIERPSHMLARKVKVAPTKVAA